MTLRSDIVSEARTWIDTPYGHQGRRKGTRVDCVGLVIGVGRTFGLTEFEHKAYTMSPDPVLMRRLCDENLNPLGTRSQVELKLGMVLLLKVDNEPQHMGIVSEINPPFIIHSMRSIRFCREQELNVTDIVVVYDYKGNIEDG